MWIGRITILLQHALPTSKYPYPFFFILRSIHNIYLHTRLIYICQVSGEKDNSYIRKLEGHKDEVNAICWSPGGRYLASCSDDSTAKIWTVEEGLKFDLTGHVKEIFTLRWTPTGADSPNPNIPLYLCTASFDGTVKVWNGESGQLVYSLARDSQPVYSLAPSPDGKWLASGSLGGKISIWSLGSGELVRYICILFFLTCGDFLSHFADSRN